MDIWKPLPPETNTVYVVKLPSPGQGNPIEYTPDPGTRARVYMARAELKTDGAAVIRRIFWELASGSDVVARVYDTQTTAANTTKFITLINGFGQVGFLGAVEVVLPWDPGVYLVHGMVLRVSALLLRLGDEFMGMKLYVDVWHDMAIRTGGRE